MKKIIFSLFILTATASAFAQEMSDKEKQEIFAMQCGSVEDIAKAMGTTADQFTDKDKKEISEIRSATLAIVKDGSAGIKKLLEDGSKSDTGVFGAVLACGLVDQISDMIKEKGCLDLETNQVIKASSEIDNCSELVKKLKSK